MKRCVEESFALAKAFDGSTTNHDLKSSMRFLFNPKDVVTHDTAGVGAAESVDNVLTVKIKSESGKQHKHIKRVLDYWNKVKEEKVGEE